MSQGDEEEQVRKAQERYEDAFGEYKTKLESLEADYKDLIHKLIDGSTEASEAHDKAVADLTASHKAGLDALYPRLMELRPLSGHPRDLPPTNRAAYSDRAAAMMSKLAMLAYDRFDEHDSWTDIITQKLDHGDKTLVGTFNSGAPCDTQGYLCEHEKFAVLVFRGTTGDLDWKTNAKSSTVKLANSMCELDVHSGFLAAYQAAEPQILELLARLPPKKSIYITGHSLGGALSVIASACLPLADERLSDRLAAVYTFGAPRVAKPGFDKLVKSPHYRVANKNDIVPTLPPAISTGYRHSGDVRFLSTTDSAPDRFNPIRGTFYNLFKSLGAKMVGKSFSGVTAHQISQYVLKLELISKARNDLL